MKFITAFFKRSAEKSYWGASISRTVSSIIARIQESKRFSFGWKRVENEVVKWARSQLLSQIWVSVCDRTYCEMRRLEPLSFGVHKSNSCSAIISMWTLEMILTLICDEEREYFLYEVATTHIINYLLDPPEIKPCSFKYFRHNCCSELFSAFQSSVLQKNCFSCDQTMEAAHNVKRHNRAVPNTVFSFQ